LSVQIQFETVCVRTTHAHTSELTRTQPHTSLLKQKADYCAA